MSLLNRSIQVDYELRVYFTQHAFGPANPLLKEVLLGSGSEPPRRAWVVLDESLARLQPGLPNQIETYFECCDRRLTLAAPPLVIEGGERVKNAPFRLSEIYSHLDRHHIDRQSYVIAVGGGALLDLVGLAAATAHRGVRLVRLPSTTLSQADSGVGVKNGINAFGKKNFLGTFAPPFAVINDFRLLDTLPPREKRSGYVEAVKVALIRDAAFFEALERDAIALAKFESAALQRMIHRCAELHLDHIAGSGDPFERGSARPLDFGHWSAHKLEQMSDYRVPHGEAVAVGIALDVLYATRVGSLGAGSAERSLRLLEALGFELFSSELLHLDASGAPVVLEGLEEFREHLGGELTVTQLRAIGRSFEVHEMNPAGIRECIFELQQRQEQKNSQALPEVA